MTKTYYFENEDAFLSAKTLMAGCDGWAPVQLPSKGLGVQVIVGSAAEGWAIVARGRP